MSAAPVAAPGTSAVPAPVAPVPTQPSNWQVVVAGVRTLFEGTPGRMRLYGALSIVACLLFGALAFIAASTRAGALADARSDAAQLVRVQSIRIDLVSADASLTNAFLIGGLEPASERATYEAGIRSATSTLAEAAGAKPADAAGLDQVNNVIAQYTGLVESARANNRQGYPVGAAYLRQATGLLRSDALPPLEQIAQANQDRVNQAYDDSARAVIWLIVGLVLALAALLAAQIFLVRRTRRVFNVALVTATVIVLVVGLGLAGVMAWSQSKANSTRSDAYFTTLELSSARVAAFDAKSAESLTLINRGSGQSYQALYAQRAGDVRALLGDAADRSGGAQRDAYDAFVAYDAVHTKIRALDDAGDWDGAVVLATGTGATDSNALFAAFDEVSAGALDDSAKLVHDELGSARAPLMVMSWVALVAGIVAALAAYRGISTRLREYR